MASYNVGSFTQKSNTFLLNISASNINTWVTQNIPAHSTITGVSLTFSAQKAFSAAKGSIEIKVGGNVAYEESNKVTSNGWYNANYNLINYVQTSGANAGKISGDVQIYIDGPWTSLNWTVNNVAINFTFNDPPYYKATFVINGVEVQSESLVAGTTPSYKGAIPSRYETLQCTYTYNGWKPELSPITSDTIYVAQYTESPREYYVNVSGGSGIFEIRGGEQSYYYGDTITLEAYNFAEHYEFLCWKDNIGEQTFVSYSNPLVVTLDEELIKHCQIGDYSSLALVGYSQGKMYNLKAEVLPDSNMGSVYFSTCWMNGDKLSWDDSREVIVPNEGINYRYGEYLDDLALKAVPNEGYRFVRWSDGVADNPRIVSNDGNYSYTAVFEKITCYVEIEQLDAKVGTITGAVSGVYEYGTELTLTANLNYGYVFERWHIIGEIPSTDNPVTFVVKGDTEVYLEYETLPKYYCTFTSIGNGKIIGAETGYYYDGIELTVTAVPDEGNKFVKWEDGSTESTRTVVIKNYKTQIKAYFEPIKINNILADTIQSSGVLSDTVEPIEMLADTTKVYG